MHTMVLDNVSDLQAMIELLPNPVIVKNDDHRVVMVNQLACELFQRSREVLTVQRAEDLFNAAEAQVFHDADDRVFATGAIDENEERITDAMGEVRYLITRKRRLEINGDYYLIAVLTDVTAYREAEAQSRYAALHDALTGLPNRILFWQRIEEAVRKSPGQSALLFIDLDNFKAVNYNYGHPAGDDLIRSFVHRLLNIIRSADTVARIGGDEFAILLTNLSDHSLVEPICNRIIAEASQLLILSGRNAQIGASIGVVLPGCGLEDQAEILRRADVALYRAKREGRGCWRAYDEDFDRVVTDRRSIHAL